MTLSQQKVVLPSRWLVLIVAIVCSVGITSIVYVYRQRKADARNWDARLVLSRMVCDFNLPYENGPARQYEKLLRDNPKYFDLAGTNSGAELLYAIVGGRLGRVADTDGDGRLELCDDRGDPVIFLSEAHPADTIKRRDGTTVQVSLPPYYGLGFYISRLCNYCWFDQDLFTHEAKALAATSRPQSKGRGE